jgi:hypothetical protein
MRTTLEIPKKLLEEAKKYTGAKTNTATVIIALEELINKSKIEKLRNLRGKLNIKIDLKTLREDRERIGKSN